jgi:hypothetical protein
VKRPSGQALIEFCIMVGVFVALGIGMQVLSGWQRLQRQAVIAARETAFSAAWNPRLAGVPDLQARMAALHLDGVGTVAPGTGQSLLERDPGPAVQVADASPPGTTPNLLVQVLRPLRAVGGFLGSEFALQQQGFAQATVALHMADLPALPQPWAAAALQVEERAAVLGDDWSAAGPAQVAQRTSGLVPTGVLARQAAVLRPLLWPVRLIEPALGRLCLGLIEPERVPVDRLAGAVGGASQPGDVACH